MRTGSLRFDAIAGGKRKFAGQRRLAAKPVNAPICRSQRPGCNGIAAANSLNFRLLLRAIYRFDNLYEGVVEGAVSCEPVSTAEFPDNRENTGNFIDSAPDPMILRLSRFGGSMTYQQIPYSGEQGN